jgi:hypothetical protein
MCDRERVEVRGDEVIAAAAAICTAEKRGRSHSCQPAGLHLLCILSVIVAV